MRVKLTKKVCLDLEPDDGSREEIYWDILGSGLGVRVTPLRTSGIRGRYFVLGYTTRPEKGATKRRFRIYQIGSVGRWTLEQASDEATRLNARVNDGGDPVEERRGARRKAEEAKTLQELAEIFMRRHHGTELDRPRMDPANPRKSLETKYAREDRGRWLNHVLPAMGKKLVKEIEPGDIDDFLQQIGKQYPVAANRLRAMLSKAFGLAERWKLRPRGSNPVTGTGAFREERRQRIPTDEELRSVLEALQQVKLEQLEALASGSGHRKDHLSCARQTLCLLLLAETGARPNEVLRLRWDWVLWSERILDIPKVKADRRDRRRAAGRRLGLSQEALSLLAQARDLADGSEHAFPSVRGDSHLTTLRRAWAEALARAGVKGSLDIYAFRHKWTSLSEKAGVGLGNAQHQLGHGDIRTTQGYWHGDDRALLESADAMSLHLRGIRSDPGAEVERQQ